MTCQLCQNCPFDGVKDKKEIIYEIHITVDNKDSFVDDCYSLGIKPIIIDMGEGIPRHAMTSSTLKYKTENDVAVLSWANHIADAFRDRGYLVKRIKIETVPWHGKASDPEPHQYFETHFAVKNDGDNYALNEILKHSHFLHRSRNLLKRGDDKYQMITYRHKSPNAKEFLKDVDYISFKLRDEGLVLDKVISEFALYDTNVEMDDQWLKSQSQK